MYIHSHSVLRIFMNVLTMSLRGYIHTCIHAYIHASTHIHTYITYIHTYIHTCKCAHTHVHIYPHTHVVLRYMHECIQLVGTLVYMHTYMHMYTHTYTRILMLFCDTCTNASNWLGHLSTCIHTYIHMYTHTYIPAYSCCSAIRSRMNPTDWEA